MANLKDLATTLFNAYTKSGNATHPTVSGFTKLLQRGYDPALMLKDANVLGNGRTLASIVDTVDDVVDSSKLFDMASIGDTFTGLNIAGAPNAPLNTGIKTLFNTLKKNPTQYIYNGKILK